MFEEFQNLSQKAKEFVKYYDFNDAFVISGLAKDLANNLKELNGKAKNLNFQEKFLGFEVTDMSEFEICEEEFEKFHLLWEFAEKWKYVIIFSLAFF